MADPRIAAYFTPYQLFNFIPSRGDWRQYRAFNALAKDQDWSQDRRNLEYDRFKDTWTPVLEDEFSGSSLQDYQNLCEELGISPVPDSRRECRRQLERVYVNVVDLVQFRRDRKQGRPGVKPEIFDNVDDLRRHSQNEARWIPPETARAELLRVLLKVFHEPNDEE